MHQLVLTRSISAPPARVFAAWCEPETLRQWFAPGDLVVAEVAADARPGGRYRVVMQEPGGKQHIVGGQYVTVQPDSLLELTWQWEGSEAVTRVRVDLRAEGDDATALTLTHSQFAEAETRDSHEQGWTGCLAKLPAAARAPSEAAPQPGL